MNSHKQKRRQERIELIIKKVKENPDNLSKAFRIVAEIYNVLPSTIRNIYYLKIKNQHNDILNCSSDQYTSQNNTKNKIEKKVEDRATWRKVIDLFETLEYREKQAVKILIENL